MGDELDDNGDYGNCSSCWIFRMSVPEMLGVNIVVSYRSGNGMG